MEYDTFFSSQRWAILEIIARSPSSPVGISEKLRTSVSYISQQLKLLEAAGIVVKVRTGAANKGKPRLIYSVAKEVAHVALLIKGQPEKRKLVLDEHHIIVLNIWMLDKELHKPLEKLYWKIEDELFSVKGIFIDFVSGKQEVFVVSDSKKIKMRVESFSKENSVLKIFVVSEEKFASYKKEGLKIIHDPNFILRDEKQTRANEEVLNHSRSLSQTQMKGGN